MAVPEALKCPCGNSLGGRNRKGAKGFCSRRCGARGRYGDSWNRFWAQVVVTQDGCWLWTGGTTSAGYGRFEYGDGKQPAHRIAYEALVGPIPDGLELDNVCRNPRCVRPDHLEPVTHLENMLRGARATNELEVRVREDGGVTARSGAWMPASMARVIEEAQALTHGVILEVRRRGEREMPRHET